MCRTPGAAPPRGAPHWVASGGGEAVWFAFPAEPLPLALNVFSKILCFVAAIMLFAWRPDEEGCPAGA